MNAEIKKEIEEGVGLTVNDNMGIVHRMVVGFDGEIKAHKTDTYPDPADRTNEEDESFSQARRFAKYHVYREKGYDTLETGMNPDRIAAVLAAVHTMDDQEFASLFEPFYRQVTNYDTPSSTPPINPSEHVDPEEFRLYLLDIYLDADLREIQQTAAAYGAEFEKIAAAVEERTTNGFRQKLANFGGQVQQRLETGDLDLPSFTIKTVSDVQLRYYEATNEDRTIGGSSPVDREPDARLELTPMPSHPIEQFRPLIEDHLLCQIRDCYVGTGQEPPAQYRVLGPGLYKFSQKYRHFDCYPDYVDTDADIPGYRS